MRNIDYSGYLGRRLPKSVQMERMRNVIREELTPVQRDVLMAYYFQGLNIVQIASNRGVNKSSVSRALRRAEKKLQKYLKY